MDVSTLLADPSAISLEAFVSVQNLIMEDEREQLKRWVEN
jgi:hypothetical protein